MLATAFGLVVAVAVLGAEIEPAATEAVTEIDGDWIMVSYSIDGHGGIDEKSPEDPNLLRLEKGDCRTVEKSKLGKPAGPDVKESEDTDDDTKVEYRLNTTQDPKHIDWLIRDPDGKNPRTGQGIYRLKDDELVICFTVTESESAVNDLIDDGSPNYDLAESPRPTTFEPARHMLVTLKRATAGKNSP